MRILGIDPGSVVCGYGVIDIENHNTKLVEYGVINAGKVSANIHLRLKEIFERLTTVITRTSPNAAAFETIFYSKNVQSLIKLSHARAAAIVAAVSFDLPIFEYSPREVKKSVTGNGNAGKQQVQYMIRSLLKIEETPELFDATDALAVAMCHSVRSTLPKTSARSWSEFIKNNPDRIVKQ